jgi:Arc/MetJ-type ribon-helix-helix transcriptional regulator
MKTIEVQLPGRLTAELEGLIKDGWFADESELVRAALWEFVRRNRFALTVQFQRADIAWALQHYRQQTVAPLPYDVSNHGPSHNTMA